jgi:branched-chain amino acid transport system substrate-binding protein
MTMFSHAFKARWPNRAMAGVAALLLSVGSASGQSVPGVSDTEIRLGGVMALSGPVRFVTEPMEKAIKAYFNDVNSRGGVHQRKIVWSIEDDAYQPARTLAGARKLAERDGVFAIIGLVGAPTTAAVLPYIEQAKIPIVSINGMPDPAPKYGFGLQASYADLMYQLTRHLVAKAGMKKLGYLYQNDDLGEIGRRGITRALKELNAESALIVSVGYERGSTDYTTQVLRLRDAGAETVVAMGTVGSVAASIKQAGAIGYKPTWATYAIGASATMQKLVGDQVDGMFFGMETEVETSTGAGLAKANAIVQKDYPGTTLDYNSMLGYAVAELTVKILEAAGRDVTREKFVQAAEAIGRYQGDTMLVSLSATKHTGADSIAVYQWKGGKVVMVSEPQTITPAPK